MENMEINPSKIFEVYESRRNSKRQLYTASLAGGHKVYGENTVTQDGVEFREWNPFKSKLAASILKGSPNIFIRKNDVVLYLGSASGTTVSHVSDIVGRKGLIFAVDISPRVMRDLIFVCYERKNIAPILADANKTGMLLSRVSAVDSVYQDIAQRNQIEIFLKNTDIFLKSEGYGLLAVKARSIDVNKQPKKIFSEVNLELKRHFSVIDFRELDPFQKDHCMFIVKKK